MALVKRRSSAPNLRTPKRNRTMATFVKKEAIKLATNAVRSIGVGPANVGNLYDAGKMVSKAVQAVANRVQHRQWTQTDIKGVKRQSKLRRDISTGIYKGSFSRPRKNKETLETTCLKKGYHLTLESYGVITDPHCAYIMHHTYHMAHCARAFIGAMIRELFSMGGYQVNQKDRALFLEEGGSSNQFRICYESRNPITGVITSLNTDIDGNPTFAAVLEEMNPTTEQILNYFKKETNNAPYAFTLFQADDTSLTTRYRMVAHIDAEQVHVTMPVVSSLVIQNRTSGALATGDDIGDSDRVDNQPLKGYLYEFNGADPRFKVTGPDNTLALNFAHETGLSLVRATTLLGALNEPPVPKLWSNCRKSVKVYLNPGDMKKTTIYHVYKGTLRTLFSKMVVRTYVTPNFSHGPGKAQLFGLEEKIRTDSANVININYEREIKVGCYLKRFKKHIPLTTELTNTNVNNTG